MGQRARWTPRLRAVRSSRLVPAQIPQVLLRMAQSRQASLMGQRAQMFRMRSVSSLSLSHSAGSDLAQLPLVVSNSINVL